MPGLRIELDTSSAERGTRRLRKDLTALGASAATNEDEFKKLERRLHDGMSADKASRKIDNLKSSLKLTRLETARLQARLGDTTAAFKTLSGGVSPTKAALVAATAAMVALGAATVKATRTGMEFEQTMKTVEAVSRATNTEIIALTASARKMGATTEWSATQAAESLKFLSMAGMQAAESITALPGMLDLATAAQTDLATASDIATDTLTAFGMKTEEITRLSDAMVNTSIRANTTVTKMGESFKYVAPVASSMGYSIEEASGFLGILANSGIKAEMAGTSLRQTMLRTGKAAKSLGMDIGSNLIDVLEEMHDRQYGVNDVVEQFGIIASTGATILMNNVGAYKKLTKEIKEGEGATKKLAKMMRDSLNNDFKILGSTIDDAFLSMYEIFGPNVRALVHEMTKAVTDNKDSFDALGQFISKSAVVFTGFISAASSATKIVTDMWNVFIAIPEGFIDFFIDVADEAKDAKEEITGMNKALENIKEPELTSLDILIADSKLWYKSINDGIVWFTESLSGAVAFISKTLAEIVKVFLEDFISIGKIINAVKNPFSNWTDVFKKEFKSIDVANKRFLETIEKDYDAHSNNMGKKMDALFDKLTKNLAETAKEAKKTAKDLEDGLTTGAGGGGSDDPIEINIYAEYEEKIRNLLYGTLKYRIKIQQEELDNYKLSKNKQVHLVEFAEAEILKLKKQYAEKNKKVLSDQSSEIKSFYDDYDKATLTSFEFQEKKLIEKYFTQLELARTSAVKMIEVDDWYLAELKKLKDKKTDEEKKESDKRLKEQDKLHREYLKKEQDAYDALYEKAEGFTDRMINNWDDMGTALVSMAEDMFKDIAAAFLTKTIVMPIYMSVIGSTGVDSSGTEGTGSTGLVSGVSSLYNSMSNNTAQTASNVLQSEIVGSLGESVFGSELWGTYGGIEAGTGAVASSGIVGALVENSFYGVLGNLGYTYIGDWLGLPQSEYSGLGASIGAIGGAAAGTAIAGSVAGTAVGTAAAGGAASGISSGAAGGSWAGPVGAVVGAIVGGVAAALLGGSDDPDLRLGLFPSNETFENDNRTLLSDDYNYMLATQDTDASNYQPIIDYYDEIFKTLDEETTASINEIIGNADTGIYGRIGWFDIEGMDYEEIISAMNDSLFDALHDGLVKDIGEGIDPGVFDINFFESIQDGEEVLLDTYLNFRDTVETMGIDDFLDQFNYQMTVLGLTAEEAYENMQNIATVITALDDASYSLSTTDTLTTLGETILSWEVLTLTLEAAKATTEQLADAEKARNEIVGSDITGLTAETIRENVLSGGDISAILESQINNLASSVIAEDIYNNFISEMNEEVGAVFADSDYDLNAVIEYLNNIDTTDAQNEILEMQEAFGLIEVAVIDISDASRIVTLAIDGLLSSSQQFQAWEIENIEALALYTEMTAASVTREELESAIEAFVDLGLEGDQLNTVIQDLADRFTDATDQLLQSISDIEDAQDNLTGDADSSSYLDEIESVLSYFQNIPTMGQIRGDEPIDVFDPDAYMQAFTDFVVESEFQDILGRGPSSDFWTDALLDPDSGIDFSNIHESIIAGIDTPDDVVDEIFNRLFGRSASGDYWSDALSDPDSGINLGNIEESIIAGASPEDAAYLAEHGGEVVITNWQDFEEYSNLEDHLIQYGSTIQGFIDNVSDIDFQNTIIIEGDYSTSESEILEAITLLENLPDVISNGMINEDALNQFIDAISGIDPAIIEDIWGDGAADQINELSNAINEFSDVADDAASDLLSINSIIDDTNYDIVTEGMTSIEKTLYDLAIQTEETRKNLIELGASEDDLAIITAAYVVNLYGMIDDINKTISDELETIGMSDVEKEIYDINAEYEAYINQIDAINTQIDATLDITDAVTDVGDLISGQLTSIETILLSIDAGNISIDDFSEIISDSPYDPIATPEGLFTISQLIADGNIANKYSAEGIAQPDAQQTLNEAYRAETGLDEDPWLDILPGGETAQYKWIFSNSESPDLLSSAIEDLPQMYLDYFNAVYFDPESISAPEPEPAPEPAPESETSILASQLQSARLEESYNNFISDIQTTFNQIGSSDLEIAIDSIATEMENNIIDLNTYLSERIISQEQYNEDLIKIESIYNQQLDELLQERLSVFAYSMIQYNKALDEDYLPSGELLIQSLNIPTDGLENITAAFDLLNASIESDEDDILDFTIALTAFSTSYGELNTLLNDGTISTSDYNSLFSELISLYEQSTSTIESAKDSYESFIDSIGSYLENLIDDSKIINLSYERAKREYQSTLSAAMSGDTEAQDNLTNAATSFLNASLTYNSSQYDYQRDIGIVRRSLGDAEDLAENNIVVIDKLLEEAIIQTDGLTDIASAVALSQEAVTDTLIDINNLLITQQSEDIIQISGLFDSFFGGDSDMVTLLDDILIALRTTIPEPTIPKPTIPEPTIPETTIPTYESFGSDFGTSPPDGMDLELWAAEILYRSSSGGVNSASFKAAKELLGVDRLYDYFGETGDDLRKTYGFKDGGISTGPISGHMELLHGTEAIIPLKGGYIPVKIKSDNKELISEIKKLKYELLNANIEIIKTNKKIHKILDRVNRGGTTIRTSEVAASCE